MLCLLLHLPQKGKGDVKQKGKLDPYAYVPLRKAQLNRRYEQAAAGTDGEETRCLIVCVSLGRKRAKLQGQFKGMVRGAQKGALSGKKMQKKMRKS